MDHKRIACGRTLIFHLLIVLGTCNFIPKETHALQVLQNLDVHYHGGGDDEATVHEVVQEKQKMDLHSSHSSSSSQMMNSVDPGLSIFFNLKDLKLGMKMAICLENEDSNPPLSSPYLLQTKKEADAIPFSLKQLPKILEYFSIPQGSRKAQVMENTLQECEIKPIEGETKFCATSYESLVDLAREILGFETNIQVLSTTIDYPTSSTNNVGKAIVHEYTIVQLPQQISAPKMISCHTMHYPYLIIHCHSQLGNGINRKGNRIYRTSLLGENGEKVEALAVCHMDTSLWNHDHASFRLLGIQPGTAPVCHFLPTQSFALLPSTTSSSIF
uniref:BURP domain-containing protein n=1 Tax=Ophiorrhiza pumila TaxID=157934 RepID=A0A140KER1_9GENT|nr:hypothetical protein [Ophiorrhiza pumila]